MLQLRAWLKSPLKQLRHSPWPISKAVAPRLDTLQPIEEEKTPYYDPKRFYPARLGDILNGRYQIATKLGFGSLSTVWLARDLYQWRWAAERYVTVKINAKDSAEGRHFVRTLLDSFTLKGPSGEHVCLVFEPLREPLWRLKTRLKGGAIPEVLIKLLVQILLHGLDFLHSECHVIHADLKLDNIMVHLEDKSILERDAHDEHQNPLPQKSLNDRTIYPSRNDYGQPASMRFVSIVDFGSSVRGGVCKDRSVQAQVYRAPKVILGASWSYSADVWSLGVLLWDLLENKYLFQAVDPVPTDFNINDQTHLAHITALIGPPPQDLLAQGKRTPMFYDIDGKLKAPPSVPTNFTLESSISKISGENKRMFLKFVGRMLKWRPEDRSTAKDLLDDPWLRVPPRTTK